MALLVPFVATLFAASAAIAATSAGPSTSRGGSILRSVGGSSAAILNFCVFYTSGTDLTPVEKTIVVIAGSGRIRLKSHAKTPVG